jgi:hypothetical protein
LLRQAFFTESLRLSIGLSTFSWLQEKVAKRIKTLTVYRFVISALY